MPRITGYPVDYSQPVVRCDVTATSQVDVSKIPEQNARCILMANKEDEDS